MAGQPKLADNQASTAMDALLGATNPAASPVHAVVTTEQQLFQRAASLPDANSVVSSWLPPGPTAIADYPTVLLSGDWLSQEQVSAASGFDQWFVDQIALVGEVVDIDAASVPSRSPCGLPGGPRHHRRAGWRRPGPGLLGPWVLLEGWVSGGGGCGRRAAIGLADGGEVPERGRRSHGNS